MIEFNIVQQLAAVGLAIMCGIYARQKYQEKKKGANAKAGQSCSTCA